jgi:hypothetical protein
MVIKDVLNVLIYPSLHFANFPWFVLYISRAFFFPFETTDIYALQERNVTNNGDGQTVDNPETVIKLLTDENSSLKER